MMQTGILYISLTRFLYNPPFDRMFMSLSAMIASLKRKMASTTAISHGMCGILMEPEDIKQDYILVKHGKGSKERVVPKSPALSKQLVKYCTLRDGYLKEHPTRYKNLFPSKNGKPMTDEAVARILKHAAKEVGVSSSVRVSPHTCRHTFAQMQLKNGLDLYSVSRLMGHVNIMITQRYLLGIKDKDIVDRGTQTSPLMNL